MFLPAETLETLLPGRLKIYQKKKGVRFSTDAVLLSYFANVHQGERVLEIGTGSGVIALLLAFVKGANVTAVEIQKEYADMARRSVLLNQLGENIQVVEGDVRSLRLSSSRYDVVVSNPPFYPYQKEARRQGDAARIPAMREKYLTLEELSEAVHRHLSVKGRVYMIYPAERREEWIRAMKSVNIHLKSEIVVYPQTNASPSRVLLEGVREKPVSIETDSLVLRSQGTETEEMINIYRSLGYFEESR
ncbi:MAG: methyltransferase [Tissierellia bacterium]|nr:methyltransferase [Bacillota bacterium]NLL22876.1 methyltransferase [Tissierellia bacterium]